MPSKEIIPLTTYFPLQSVSKSVSCKILGLKLVKLDSTIIYLDPDTIKKATYELDGACGLPLLYYCFIKRVCFK